MYKLLDFITPKRHVSNDMKIVNSMLSLLSINPNNAAMCEH